MYEDATTKVKVRGKESKAFNVKKGVYRFGSNNNNNNNNIHLGTHKIKDNQINK